MWMLNIDVKKQVYSTKNCPTFFLNKFRLLSSEEVSKGVCVLGYYDKYLKTPIIPTFVKETSFDFWGTATGYLIDSLRGMHDAKVTILNKTTCEGREWKCKWFHLRKFGETV